MDDEIKQMRVLLRRIQRSMESPDNGLWLTTSKWTKKERDNVIKELCKDVLAKFPEPPEPNWETIAFQAVLSSKPKGATDGKA